MSELINVESLEDLMQAIASNEKVVVVFSARDWCVPCQRLHPHVIAAAKELPDYTFLDVDVDHVENVKEEFDIMKVPQIWYYENDGTLGHQINAQTTAVKLVADLKS